MDAVTATSRHCTAESAAALGSFSPIRRATIAVAPIESPIPTAYTMVSSDSVRPTVATAEGPREDTKYTSTTAKTDSITISSIIGTDNSKIDRPRLPWV